MQYISEFYDIHHLYGTWSAEFNSYGLDMHYRDLSPGHAKWVPNDALKKVGRGRRQSRRIRNDMDDSQRGQRARRQRCRLCKTFGHALATCPNRPGSSNAP